jgi:Kinetochore complex Sim4 subunit Fta1
LSSSSSSSSSSSVQLQIKHDEIFQQQIVSSRKQLLSKTWRLHRCSPLHGWLHSASAKQIEMIEKRLETFIESSQSLYRADTKDGDNDDTATTSTTATTATATSTTTTSTDKDGVISVKICHFADGDEIAINVFHHQQGAGGQGSEFRRVPQLACVCVLSKADLKPSDHKHKHQQQQQLQHQHQHQPESAASRVVYPLMMAHGNQSILSVCQSFLQQNFDCFISPLSLASHELAAICSEWALDTKSKQARPLQLVFGTPDSITGIDKLNVKLPAEACTKLCSQCPDPLRALRQHMQHYFSIDIATLHLIRVGTTAALVNNTGKAKLLSEMHLPVVLAHFVQLCTPRSHGRHVIESIIS